MDELNSRFLRRGEPRSGPTLGKRVGNGAAGIGLLLGGGAAYFLSRASTDTLATTSSTLLITGLAGLVLMAAVVALRLLVRRHGQGGHGPGQRIPTFPLPNLGVQLLLVSDDGRLRPASVQATGRPMHERRRAA